MIVRPLSVTSTPGWPARASAITLNQRMAATMQIATGTWNPTRPDPHHHGEVNATPQRAFQQPSAGHGRRLPIGRWAWAQRIPVFAFLQWSSRGTYYKSRGTSLPQRPSGRRANQEVTLGT